MIDSFKRNLGLQKQSPFPSKLPDFDDSNGYTYISRHAGSNGTFTFELSLWKMLQIRPQIEPCENREFAKIILIFQRKLYQVSGLFSTANFPWCLRFMHLSFLFQTTLAEEIAHSTTHYHPQVQLFCNIRWLARWSCSRTMDCTMIKGLVHWQ